jgi:hypothetical protein
VGRCGLDESGSRQGPMVGSYEHGNEPSGFMTLDCSCGGQVFFFTFSTKKTIIKVEHLKTLSPYETIFAILQHSISLNLLAWLLYQV